MGTSPWASGLPSHRQKRQETCGNQQSTSHLGDLLFPTLWRFGCQSVQVTAVDTGLCRDSAIPGTEEMVGDRAKMRLDLDAAGTLEMGGGA